MRAPPQGSYEERLLRLRLWTLPVVYFGLSFAWSVLSRRGILPDLPYGAVWAFLFVWWVFEAAPRPYSLRSTFGRLPSRSDIGCVLLLLVADYCLRGAWWFGRSTWQLLLAGTIPSSFDINLQSAASLPKIAIAILVAPLLEELLWRGTLFRKWRARFGPRTALLLSSLLFGALHDEKVASTLVGATLVLLYTRSGSLWTPLLFHVVNNAVGSAMGEWGTLHISLGSGWKLTLFLSVLLTGSAVWLRFLLQSWQTLGAPLPPDSLLPPAVTPSAPTELPTTSPHEPLRAGG